MRSKLATYLTSSILLLGATGAQATLPDSAKLYKNPSCGCCDDYAKYLESQGIDVEIIKIREIGRIKEEAGIPYGQGACHTVMLGDYVIEGHVPFAAINKLFSERPDINGIGLAGMPSGTPGMPGPQQAPYEIMSFNERKATPFLLL